MASERTYYVREVTVSYRSVGSLASLEPMHTPEVVVEGFRRLVSDADPQESFWTVALNTRHRLISFRRIFLGSLNQSLVHPREIFASLLEQRAHAFLIVHNHPSGDPTPSREDHEVTRRLREAGEILGIKLIDHLIVAESGFYSYAREGRL